MKIGITERGDASVHLYEWRGKLDQVDGAILITKDPQFLLEHLNQFDSSKCLFHCTITGWGGTYMEPHVPVMEHSLEAYNRLVSMFGPERVVLRIDPIIPTKNGVDIAKMVLAKAKGRVRISFLDMYKHVYARIKKANADLYGSMVWMTRGKVHTGLTLRKKILAALEEVSEHTIEICGEPGMACTGCISTRDLVALELQMPSKVSTSKQRKACACLALKTELLTHRGQCKHGCLYCYWR